MDSSKIICLIDMDCFYVQVEQIAAPEFLGQPCGVYYYYYREHGSKGIPHNNKNLVVLDQFFYFCQKTM